VRRRLTRIGLSATQKPIDEVARFLVGRADAGRAHAPTPVVDVGYAARDLALELPRRRSRRCCRPTSGRCPRALAELALAHRTTLVFVNTRRMAERVARTSSERLGKDSVAAHHGSLAKEHGSTPSSALKRGELRVLVATASLELGIDIGDVDLVCQIGSPRSIAAFLQRVGRSGHAVGGVAEGPPVPAVARRPRRVRGAARSRAPRRARRAARVRKPARRAGAADRRRGRRRDWDETRCFALVRRAYPFATLSRAQFDAVVAMLVAGLRTRGGTRAAMLHRDEPCTACCTAAAARASPALTSGGTIPDMADYEVVLEPAAQTIAR
jgi:ATP-dependent Lhr-like helicase